MKTNNGAVVFLFAAVLGMAGLGFPFGQFPLPAQEPAKKLPPLAARLARTSWINTNKVTFEWDDKGRFFHSGKEREYQVIDDSRLKIVFGENHVDTLVFDAQLTSFEQFSTREPKLRPLFTGKVVARSEAAEKAERERREVIAKAERERQEAFAKERAEVIAPPRRKRTTCRR